MTHKNRDQYVDLKINGRLFPSWVLANFKEYKLPEIVMSNDDPCKTINYELKKYQIFISKYLDFYSPYKNILLYFGLGAGKTGTAINLYNMLYNYTPGWNVFILLKATLTENWKEEMNIFLSEEDRQSRIENVKFISYDAPNANEIFMREIKKSDTSKKNMFIVEEAHNFISNVYNNISSQQGKKAQAIYDYIIQDQLENQDTRVIALSATPAINNPYEIALLFNLLRPNSFSKSETLFNQEFISQSSYKTINPLRKNMFQRRIMGLVSYYIGSTPDYFASKEVKYVNVAMSEYQRELYQYFEDIETKIAKKKKSNNKSSETYKSYTRQSCNFVFPIMAQGKSGDKRPRPKDFSITETTGLQIQTGKLGKTSESEKDKEKYYSAENYLAATKEFVNLFEKYIDEFAREDEKNKHTIMDDFNIFKEKYDLDFDKFCKDTEPKSSVFTELHTCSAKFLNAVFLILSKSGPALVYTNYVLMEGIEIFRLYLKFVGFTQYNVNLTNQDGKDYFRFTEYHGGIDKSMRAKVKKHFNLEDNKYGKLCKVIIISPAGAEGISLSSVRSVHILEPYWHEIRINQMIGRSIRFCSHKYLPLNERHVDVYRYKSVIENSEKKTTDQYIEKLAQDKEILIESFQNAIKEVAIDCVLYRSHNMLSEEYKCFQFEEKSLMVDQVQPAYKEDFQDDAKIDNGSNSVNAQTISIDVAEIKAVKQLTKELPFKYSDPEYYWYSSDSHTVYDHTLHYPIGKIATSDDDIPIKLDKDTYVIDKIIHIPIIKQK